MRRFSAAVIGSLVFLAVIVLMKYGSFSTSLVWDISGGGEWLLPLVAISALIDSVNPCAFSVLLLTIVVLVGLGKTRGAMIKYGAVYIGGLFTAYFLIGLGLLQALHIFSVPHFMGKLAALLLLLLGLLELVGVIFPGFPIKFRIPSAAHGKISELMGKATFPAMFLLGALVGLCEFPCTGGPYLAVLGLLHDTQTYLRGVGYLILYNALFVLPLVVILYLSSRTGILERLRAWQRGESRSMRLWGALAMVALAVIIYLI